MKFLASLIFIPLVVLAIALFTPPKAYAATSPTLSGASGYSVLGGFEVTNTGTTTASGAVGVSPGVSITGQATLTAGGGIHVNDASAIAAQADRLIAYGTLNAGANADANCINPATGLAGIAPDATDLRGLSLIPGLYCSAGSFLLTNGAGTDLTLSGSTGVWVFKTVSTLIVSNASSVTGGDPCNVWWRIGSAATLGTTTSFLGNIVTGDVADTTALQTGATLNGRVLAGDAHTVALDGNTISLTCSAAASSSSSSTSTSSSGTTDCPPLSSGINTPIIISSNRVSPTSIFLSWGPYSGTDTFIIQYGFSNGNWQYSTNVTGFSTTIGGLPAGQPIWVRIAARNNCSIGIFGLSRLVGGPLLPNTGFVPGRNDIHRYAPAGIGITILGFFVLRKRGLSSGN
ncbi:MAG: ice-binding family protein [bacterium]|nr:ice-binding family protein [bacterium]